MNFRNLEAYKYSVRFLPMAARIAAQMPKGYSDLAGQLRRASTSVPLNIGEGSGKRTTKNQKRYYGDARGSAMECAAIVDAARELDAIDAPTQGSAIEVLGSIVRMLSKMCL